MRRFAVLLLLALMLGAPQAGALTRKARNRVDHYRYVTCSTCPRAPQTYDGGYVTCITRKVQGIAENRLGDRLYDFWQWGKACFDPPSDFHSMHWDAGTGAGNQWWNAWGEVTPREVHKKQGSGPPPWRYRRTEFSFEASYAAWTLNEHKWAAQTFRSDGGYTPGHS